MSWKCRVCTLENGAGVAACGACGIRNGQAARWIELVDPTSHRKYYYDEVGKTTQWEPPEAPVTRAVALPPPPRGSSPSPSDTSAAGGGSGVGATTPGPAVAGDAAVQEADAPTVSSVRQPRRAPAEWRCGRCTYSNPGVVPSCTMCGTGRVGGAQQPQPQDAGWACPSCTLQNTARDTRCQVCQSPRQQGAAPQQADRQASIRRHVEQRISASGSPAGGPNGSPLGDPLEGSLLDPLVCSRCTFRNAPAWQECTVCGFANAAEVRGGSGSGGGGGGGGGLPPRQASGSGCESFSFIKQMSAWMQRVQEVEAGLRRGTPFLDDTFPPDNRSLCGPDGEATFGQHDRRDVVGWKRFCNTAPRSGQGKGAWTFAKPDPDLPGVPYFSPDSIQQGQLGDCWFLSALAVVCTRPELIRRIFITQELRPTGVYALRFWHNGIWTPVIVDDHLPTTSWGGIAFATGSDRQLWPSLVEKAYAKLYGSFKAICGGTAADALTDLTGAPSTKLKLDEAAEDGDLDMAWLQLMSSAASGFLMAASCGKRDASKDAYKAIGLISNHCYTVLQVTDEIGVRLLKLRNPWGREEWLGDWGDRSPMWTPQIRRLLGHTSKNDGTFWMAFPDFINYFSYVDICKSHEDWHQQSVSEMFTKKAVASGNAQFSRPYTLRVTSPTWLFISLVQQDERGAPLSYHYQDAGVVVSKVTKETANPLDPQHFETVGGTLSQVQRITTVELILQTGLYAVFPFSLLNLTNDMRFTLALWSSKEVKLKRQVLQNLHPVVTSMHGFVRMPDVKGAKTSRPFPGIKVVMIKASHAMWFYVENRSQSAFEIRLDCSQSTGLVASRGLVTKDTIMSGQCMLINMLTSVSPYSWSYQVKQQYRLGRIQAGHSPPLPAAHHLHQVMYLTGK